MKKFYVVMVLLSIILISVSGITYDVALFDFENMGMSENDYKIAMHLLYDEMENIESYDIIPKNKVSGIVGKDVISDAKTAIKFAKLLKADKCIFGSFVPLGDKVVVRFKMIDMETEKIEFYDEVESESIEDLNVVMKRVAAGLETRQKFESTATTDTVTEDEEYGLKKRKSFHSYGMRFGFLYPQDDRYNGEHRLNTFLFTWQFETPKIITQVDFSVWGASSAFDLGFDISFLYPLTRTDVSPYLSLGLGLHSLHVRTEPIDPEDLLVTPFEYDWDHEPGFTLNGGAGFLLFRTYNFRVIFDSRVYYSFIEIGDKKDHYGVAFTFGFLMRHQEKSLSIFK